jgi:hypothetical protein
VSDHDPPAPARKSTVTELPRIEGRTEPPAPEPAPSVDELSVDAQLRGMKVRAGARGAGIAALQRVLIVLVLVAGAVAIVRIVTSPEARRRRDVGLCTEHSPPEGIERMCARDGS